MAVAEEVLGMVGRGKVLSTGDKAVVGCHPWHEQGLVEVLAVLIGVMGKEA